MTAAAGRAGTGDEAAGAAFHGVGLAPEAGTVIYALGPSGTGAGAWRPLQRQVRDIAELRAARLPGRESRFGQEPVTTVAGQVADLAPELARLVHDDARPFLLLGWCAGAITAYELAGWLQAAGARSPALLMPADQVSPAEFARCGSGAHLLAAGEFRDWCRGQLPDRPDLADDEVFEFFEPMLRADFTATATYRHDPRPPLSCPVLVVRSPQLAPPQAAGWAGTTTGALETLILGELVSAGSLEGVVREAVGRVRGLKHT